MSAIFLHPAPPRVTPLAAWLGPDVGREVALLAPKPIAAQYSGWAAQTVGFDPYEACPAVESLALRLARRHAANVIIALAEHDLLRAAHLRRVLGLPGQTVESARAFRDKAIMKQIVGAAGIEVAAHAVIETTFDLIDFVERTGFPIVVKPRCGGGSYRTAVLYDEAELDVLLLRERDLAGCLVESFIPGEMFHVDGLVHRGTLVLESASRYINGCLAFQAGTSLLSVQLDPAHPLRSRLSAVTRAVLGAMPTPKTTAFHLEVFHTPDDRLVFCEIASRVGGARVNDTIARSHGIDLARTWIELQLGARADVEAVPTAPRLCGWAVIPPRAGRIESFSRTVDVPGLVDLHVACSEGDVLPEPATSVAAMATVVAEGETERDLARTLAAAVEAFERSCRYHVDAAAE